MMGNEKWEVSRCLEDGAEYHHMVAFNHDDGWQCGTNTRRHGHRSAAEVVSVECAHRGVSCGVSAHYYTTTRVHSKLEARRRGLEAVKGSGRQWTEADRRTTELHWHCSSNSHPPDKCPPSHHSIDTSWNGVILPAAAAADRCCCCSLHVTSMHTVHRTHSAAIVISATHLDPHLLGSSLHSSSCSLSTMTASAPATYYWMCGRCGVVTTSESGLTTPWPRSTDSVDVGSCTRPACQLLQLCQPLSRQQTGPSPISDRPQHNHHDPSAAVRGGRLYRCDEHGRVLSELGIVTDTAGMPVDADGHEVEIFGYDAFGRLLQDGNPHHPPPSPLPLPLPVNITHASDGRKE